LFLKISLGGKDWLILIDGEKKENKLIDGSTFEIMEMSKGSFEIWNFKEIS
jgi:hypothetical protein